MVSYVVLKALPALLAIFGFIARRSRELRAQHLSNALPFLSMQLQKPAFGRIAISDMSTPDSPGRIACKAVWPMCQCHSLARAHCINRTSSSGVKFELLFFAALLRVASSEDCAPTMSGSAMDICVSLLLCGDGKSRMEPLV